MYRPENTHLSGGSHERDETILDAVLEELHSGEGPPDMSGRILRAHAAGRVAIDAAALAGAVIPMALPVEPPVDGRLILPPPVVAPAAPVLWVSPSARAPQRSRRAAAAGLGRQWTGIALAAAVMVGGLGVSLVALYFNGNFSDTIPIAQTGEPAVVEQPDAPHAQPTPGQAIAEHAAPIENPFDQVPFGAEDLAASPEPGVPWQVPYAIEPQQSGKIVAFVDRQLAQSWKAAGVKPAPAIDDAEWAERVTQQLLGRAPTEDELEQFAADRSPQKRETLVERMLHGDAYRAEFARHWAEVWASELVGGNVSPAQRAGLEQYLAASLAADKPFSQITHELLTATGSSDPQSPDFNGATNFVLSGIGGQRENIAGAVSRVFLGHQGQCVQCHDAKHSNKLRGDEHDGVSQQQFWQIAAFFQQARPLRDAAGATRLVDADFVGPTGDVEEAEIFYDRDDHQRKIAYPVFIDGQAISPSGRVAEVNRRAELARLIVSSESYSQASVNNWWSQLLGRGLASPDAATENHAELQRRLAEQFAAHGFDHKQLIAWIVLSEANNRAGDAGGLDPRYVAQAPLFDRFYGDQRAVAPYETFAAALDAAQRGARPLGRDGGALLAREALTRPGDDGDASIIVRSAGSLRKLDPRDYTLVDRVMASDMTFADKVKHLFLSGVGRAPSQDELQAAQATLARYEGSVAGALQELWWAIENSNEYKPAD